uniref:Fork-head domain-containing protein n=1 Tax=Nothoprocta perdicaria TaxID=30464 RepID=A0A8C6ZNN7_NOTPE
MDAVEPEALPGSRIPLHVLHKLRGGSRCARCPGLLLRFPLCPRATEGRAGGAAQAAAAPRPLRSSPLPSAPQGAAGARPQPEPPDKPSQSYIALISTAILSSPEKKLLLSDIYQWIMDHYPYFKNKKSWRNSVRHNLSLNECFVKAGRSDNGKGHFWAIHPANLEDFAKGDYHRRRARRRIRR